MMTTFPVESSIAIGLHLIANSVPDGAEKSMVARWLSEYNKYASRRARARQVLEAVSEGYDTIEEISAHTGIPRASVRRLLARFVQAKKVRQIKSKNPNNRIELRFEII